MILTESLIQIELVIPTELSIQIGLLILIQACQFVPSRKELMRMLGVNGCNGLMFAGLDKPRH